MPLWKLDLVELKKIAEQSWPAGELSITPKLLLELVEEIHRLKEFEFKYKELCK